MRPKSLRDLKAGAYAALDSLTPSATKRVRGLRDVMSSRTIDSRGVPVTRSQQLSEIAWLDREKERLDRELGILEANYLRVKTRVQEVSQHRESIMNMLRKDLGVAEAPASTTPRPSRSAAEEEEEEPEVEQISLEY